MVTEGVSGPRPHPHFPFPPGLPYSVPDVSGRKSVYPNGEWSRVEWGRIVRVAPAHHLWRERAPLAQSEGLVCCALTWEFSPESQE